MRSAPQAQGVKLSQERPNSKAKMENWMKLANWEHCSVGEKVGPDRMALPFDKIR
jgi:hypothetical protein